MYAIRIPEDPNEYIEEQRNCRYELTEDVARVVDANINDVLFDIVDGAHLREEVLARHPAPEGFTFVPKSGSINTVSVMINPYPLEGTSFEAIKEMCRQYGRIEGIGRDLFPGQLSEFRYGEDKIIDSEFVLNRYGRMEYKPEAIKRKLARKNSIKSSSLKNGAIPSTMLNKLHHWMFEIVCSRPGMSVYHQRQSCCSFGTSKTGKMIGILNNVRVMHSFYHGRNEWRNIVLRKNVNQKLYWQMIRFEDVNVGEEVRAFFPYIEGLKKRVKKLKGKLTVDDWKHWRTFVVMDDLRINMLRWKRNPKISIETDVLTRAKEYNERRECWEKVKEYIATRNFLIFLEHEQREM